MLFFIVLGPGDVAVIDARRKTCCSSGSYSGAACRGCRASVAADHAVPSDHHRRSVRNQQPTPSAANTHEQDTDSVRSQRKVVYDELH